MTPTAKALSQLNSRQQQSLTTMCISVCLEYLKKKSTVYSLQHTHAPMSIHGEVSSKHMSVGGNKKKETY